MRIKPYLTKGLAALLTLVSLCAWGTPPADPWAPYRTVWFDNITVANGLPHSTVTTIAQDPRGVIWMGTFGGLVRYDGNQLKVFGEEPDAVDGLTDAYIRALAPLPNGDLLVGTNAGGLARFDASTNRFHRYPTAQGDGTDKVFAIASDHHGGWWIATDRGLDHLNDTGSRLETVPMGPGNRGDLPSRSFAVSQDAAGNVWVGTDKGLLRRSAGTTSFEFVRDPQHPGIDAILRDGIWSLLPDRNGRLWAGTQNAGSIYLDANGWQWVPGISGADGATGRRTVRAIMQTSSGDIWFASDGAGVATWSPATGAVGILRHDPSVPSTIPGDIARSLLQDMAGNIWVSTELGAARHDVRADSVLTIPASTTQSHALTDPDVHTIFVDPRGRIWLGLGLGKIAVIDLADGSMRHLQLSGAQAQQDVQSFVAAPDGSIWVGAQGIARIDADTFAITSSVVPAMDAHLVLSLGREGDDIYMASYEGLWRVAASTPSAMPTKLTADEVRFMLRLKDRWWFPSINGISVLVDGATAFTHIRHDAADPQSLPQNYTGTATFDGRGRMWLATYGGIAYLDPFRIDGPFRFGRIGIAEGLGSAKVNAVLVDRHDRIWASLTHGVAVIDPNTLQVRNLSARDGLRIASYSHRAAATGPNGELLFGGLGGLTVVMPDTAIANPSGAALAVTDVFVDDHEMPFAQLPADGGLLAAGNVSRSIRVDFSLLDYAESGDTRYAYYLEGFDAGWMPIARGNPPVAVYTNLPGGDFRLHLRAETVGAQGRTVTSTIRLNVTLHWYESWWAKLLGVMLVLLVFGALLRLRTAYLQRRAVQLQIQIDARTLDLQEANARLDQLAGTDELTGAFNRRRFLDLAQRAVDRAHITKRPLSMVLIDLDDFKLVNDTYGHLAGDAVIRATMDLTASLCRGTDLVGRYGGEELILCLPDSDADGAWQLTERIRRALADTSVTDDGHDIMITASAGIAVLRPGEDLQTMLRRADDALYTAKNGGRNRSQLDTR